jgi:hypothetical protein
MTTSIDIDAWDHERALQLCELWHDLGYEYEADMLLDDIIGLAESYEQDHVAVGIAVSLITRERQGVQR